MVQSIFDLERRTNLLNETKKIDKYLSKRIFDSLEGSYCTFYEMVDSCIEMWPYRYTATNVVDFFDQFGISLNVEEFNDENCYYLLQFIYDFIHWLKEKGSFKYDLYEISLSEIDQAFFDLYSENKPYFNTIISNIRQIMELCNYKIEKIDKHYTFIKRDADVDSILPIFEKNEDIKLVLLEYNDFKIETNLNEKKIILKKLADYLEPLRKEMRSYDKQLTEDIFFMLNQFDIRHNNRNQILDSQDKYIEWYDKLFKMIIQLIRTKEIKKYQKELNAFKSGQIN